MSEIRQIKVVANFVCLQCAERFPQREDLETHWRAVGHGPQARQALMLDRARAGTTPGGVRVDVTLEGNTHEDWS